MSGKKSDHADAVALANILRTDADRHRQLPADSELARRIRVLARAHQDATWRRTRACNELRSVLREYYPGFPAGIRRCCHQPDHPPRRARCWPLPPPRPGRRRCRSGRSLRRCDERDVNAGLQCSDRADSRGSCGAAAASTRAGGRRDRNASAGGTGQPGCGMRECRQPRATRSITAFEQHPDHVIITSFPGLGDLTGARILGEIGDDRERFADARALKAFAGSAPVTRASGRSTTVTCRRVKNNRMAAVGFVWAFIAAGREGSTREHYLARREHGDRHPAALRHLYNRMLGQLYHCLQTDQTSEPTKAYPSPPTRHSRVAA